MRQRFDLDDFESFLSEQAEQHRMYPSDRVWSGIRENLHAKEKWPSLTFTAILTTTLIAITLTIFYPNRALLELPENFGQTIAQNDDFPIVIPPIQSAHQEEKSGKVHIYPSKVETQNLHSPLPVAENNLVSQGLTDNDGISNDDISIHASENDTNTEPSLINESLQNNISEPAIVIEKVNFKNQNGINQFHFSHSPESYNAIDPPGTEEINNTSEDLSRKAFIETSLQYQDKSWKTKSAATSRWSLQIYATPSVSYRYLVDEKAKITDPASGPVAPYLTTSVNAFVRQQPKLGLEMGGAVLYKLANNFRVKTGLQLNFRQYGIDAYASNFQAAMLTLDRGNTLDSVVQYTNISNQTGYKPIQLSNKFLQLAIPIGFDLKMGTISNKVEFYMSAASQFTYQIASSSYLLSSDFKNYMKQPDLNRKFNMNAAIEAFASFEAGGITWQAGPQIRYQLLPGATSAYRIHEHLIDYGFKIGVVKNFK
jgi:hypothetical protein